MAAVSSFNKHIHLWKPSAKPLQKRGQEIAAECGTGPDSHRSTFCALPFLNSDKRRSVPQKDLSDEGKEQLTRFSEDETSILLAVNRHAKLRFQRLQMLVNRSRTQVASPARFPDAAAFGERDKTFHFPQFHGYHPKLAVH